MVCCTSFLKVRFGHAILTIVERSTNMLFMTKLAHGKKAEPLAKEVRCLLLPYKKYIKTITTDNGPEFAAHKLITKYLGAVVYFADPYSSWQKGAIENTNKLIRQYIPKQANFDDYTDKKIAMIQKKINSRPRQILNFVSPKKEFYKKSIVILHLLVDSTVLSATKKRKKFCCFDETSYFWVILSSFKCLLSSKTLESPCFSQT